MQQIEQPQFDEVAPAYREAVNSSLGITGEGVEYFAEYKAKYLAERLKLRPRKILDYGCGVGLLSGFLGRYFPDAALHGYDVSLTSLDCIDESIRGRGFFTGAEDELASDYDLVVVANVLHHVPPAERQDVVARLGRRIASGGMVAVFEHNPLNPATRWAVAHCSFDRGVKLLPRSETQRHLSGAGLKLLSSEYIVFFPRALAALRPLERSLGWLPLGGQHVVVGFRECR